jgi:ribosomal protein S27AE
MLTVATFSKPEDAHMLRLRLEAGGVPAYIQDENMVQTDWLYSNAIGGVRVQIAEDDVDRAKEILRDPGVLAEHAVMPACPKCGSTETAPDELPRRVSFLSMILTGFPFLVSKTRWKCGKCHHPWNEINKQNG